MSMSQQRIKAAKRNQKQKETLKKKKNAEETGFGTNQMEETRKSGSHTWTAAGLTKWIRTSRKERTRQKKASASCGKNTNRMIPSSPGTGQCLSETKLSPKEKQDNREFHPFGLRRVDEKGEKNESHQEKQGPIA